MTKELVEDIMDLEAAAEARIAAAAAEKESNIRKAHEQAHLLIQSAEHTLDTEREHAINELDKSLHKQKEKIIEDAKLEAERLANQVSSRIPNATQHILKAFLEYCHDVS